MRDEKTIRPKYGYSSKANIWNLSHEACVKPADKDGLHLDFDFYRKYANKSIYIVCGQKNMLTSVRRKVAGRGKLILKILGNETKAETNSRFKNASDLSRGEVGLEHNCHTCFCPILSMTVIKDSHKTPSVRKISEHI